LDFPVAEEAGLCTDLQFDFVGDVRIRLDVVVFDFGFFSVIGIVLADGDHVFLG
jgi:hypothetical protein